MAADTVSDVCCYLFWNKDVEKVELDAHCQSFAKLIQDQHFLTTMVHALEEQKSFTIKDK